jgi:3-methyladenine DNA glycosylase AlkD
VGRRELPRGALRGAGADPAPATLALYRHLVVSGAWWDLVDPVAGHNVGDLLVAHPAALTPVLRDWAVDDDLWLRRTAVICQLHRTDDLDVDLLRHALEANLEDSRHGREFFIRKAVGWALRQRARADPDWVRAFVAEHEDRLSGLSRREALKHL